MEENKIFIIETTNNNQWEMNYGYHIVKAIDIDEAKCIAMDNIEDEVIQIVEINDFLDKDDLNYRDSSILIKGKIRTIIDSQNI